MNEEFSLFCLRNSVESITFAIDNINNTQYDPTRIHRTGDSATLRRF